MCVCLFVCLFVCVFFFVFLIWAGKQNGHTQHQFSVAFERLFNKSEEFSFPFPLIGFGVTGIQEIKASVYLTLIMIKTSQFVAHYQYSDGPELSSLQSSC